MDMLGRATRRVVRNLPRGGALPDEIWWRRHRGIVALLWLHVPAIFFMGQGFFFYRPIDAAGIKRLLAEQDGFSIAPSPGIGRLASPIAAE